ncbi:DUF547 domain-containing protein [uncultured Algibacter sp.]|uniref:DUF547 domain-containing protein n=1 Tax=uncultured Algibacter sp. TaxID=298659 RepID=UPI002630C6A1|nr:DUF547 domain-containing protein [uncultured Algibacter sp.]
MKYLQLFALFIFISSCCSTKRITESSSDKPKTEVIEITKDSITTEIETTTEIEPPKPPKIVEVDVVDDYTPEAFNHYSWNILLKKYVTNSGNVNYKGFKSNRKELTNYITSLSKNIPNDTWSNQDKLAYWINAYNAMTIDLILRHYPVKSIKDIKKPWNLRYWKLGEKWYNLNEIEHNILRKMNEPRIHFAIVCASFSCPKLLNKAFRSENIDNQLTKVTREFLSDSNRNEISQNNIKLSKIFQWFAKDFKQDGSLIDFLNTYSEITISAKAKKSFKDYNWKLNE